MAFNGSRSPAVKRLMKEAQELNSPTELYYAQPLEDNMFEWHFSIRGPIDSDFQGGIYHGRILLPAEYPMKPPSIIMLTPNGRFKVNEKICLSISGHHPETWLPSWSIRTALLALIGFMPTMGEGAIGSLDYTPEERKTLAKKSISFCCSVCKTDNATVLPVLTEKSQQISAEAKELASQIEFKNSKPNETSKENQSIEAANTESASNNANSLLKRNVSSNLNNCQSNSNQNSTTATLNPISNGSLNRSSSINGVNFNSTSSRRDENKLYFTVITILSAIFIFLFIRRIYLMLDSSSFPI